LEHVPDKPQFKGGHQAGTVERRGIRAVIASLRMREFQLMVIALFAVWSFFANADHKGVVLLMVVMFASFAAGLLIIADIFRDHSGRFSLYTLFLIVMLFALSFCALGVLIHTPALFT
jgi:FtsH-binding integral membrane protein